MVEKDRAGEEFGGGWSLSAIGCSDWVDSSVNIFSMTYSHYPDGKHLILNGIDNPVSTLTNAVSFLPGEFFMTRRARVLGERCNASEDLLEVFLRNCIEVFFNGFFEIDLIFAHLSSAS